MQNVPPPAACFSCVNVGEKRLNLRSHLRGGVCSPILSLDSSSNLPLNTCARCHGHAQWAQRAGNRAGRVTSFLSVKLTPCQLVPSCGQSSFKPKVDKDGMCTNADEEKCA